jgi:hypothetical protein
LRATGGSLFDFWDTHAVNAANTKFQAPNPKQAPISKCEHPNSSGPTVLAPCGNGLRGFDIGNWDLFVI